MGKVVKFTGSKLLGEELRRLRGARTLDDVAEMGRHKLVPFGFKSVAKATLSEIENGITLPNIESVFALSILYQVPTSRFLHLLLEENLTEGRAAQGGQPELTAAYLDALTTGRVPDALAFAIQGLRTSSTAQETAKWRVNRAIASERLGMRWDAITELEACVETPLLPAGVVCRIHRELARMHAAGGQYRMADMHLRECAGLLPQDASPRDRMMVLQARVAARLGSKEAGLELAGAGLEELEVLVADGLSLCAEDAADERLFFLLSRAELAALRGDHKEARRGFKASLALARAAELPERVIEALRGLAKVEAEHSPEQARQHLRAAADLAVDKGHLDLAFETLFLLCESAESAEQVAYYLRRCRKLYPLIQSSHPLVKRFESINRREVDR